jgi:putative ABC transport system permease protein
MLRTTLSAAWSRKRRLLGTALAIVLGVAFLSATLVLGDSAKAGFEVAFTEANAGTDALVRSGTELTGGDETVRPPIDATLVDTIASVDGVAKVVPTVEGRGQVLDAEGDPIGGSGPPTVAAGWIDDPALTGWDIATGRAPEAAGEVVIDRATAIEADVDVGDTITVLVPSPVEASVVGVATFGDDDSIGGTTYTAFTTAEAQRLLLGSEDLVSGVVVAATDGVSQDDLVSRLETALPDGTEAITGADLTDEQQADIEGDFLGFLTTALLVFACVALLVAAFSIFNTFSILVAQRTRESALLRALGASRRQVLMSALVESAIVGVLGAVVGAATGLLVASGLLSLMESAGFGLPTDGLEVSTGSLLTAVVVGMVVTMLGGVVPAWRSSRVAPLAALREVEVDTAASSRWRAVVGLAVAAAGIGVLLASSGEGELPRAGLGAVVLVIGVLLLGPVVARPVGNLLGAPLALRGVSGDLARRNAVRNPKRTSSTAAALLVGVGVVSLFTVFGASVSQSIEDTVDRTFGGELALTPAGSGFSGSGLDTGLVDQLDEMPEVEVAAGLGYGAATLDGRNDDVGFADPKALSQVAEFDVVDGDLAAVDDSDVAMSDEYATDHGYALGDTVEVGFADGVRERFTLAATYDQQAMGGDVIVPQASWTAHNPQASFFLIMVGLADGVSLDEGRTAVEALTAGQGGPDVMDRDEFVESQAAEIDVLLTIIYALLAVAILIALMGIANTLSLSVHERTRELGLLRAVGQTRSQLRAMVRWESVIVSTFGSIGGMGLGLFLAWGLVRALNAAEGFGTFVVPVGSLAVVLMVGATVGVLAGFRPAWRASRLDVLAAVAAD